MNAVPVRDAAELLGVSRQAILSMIRTERLDAERGPRETWLISLPSIERVKREQNLRSAGVSTAEAADRLGVDERTVRRYCESGELACVAVGREWRVDLTSLDEFRPPTIGRPKKETT